MRVSVSVAAAVALILGTLTTSGCLISMVVPDRFLVVDNGWGELRALTPEESKLWVREFGDDSKGSETFWRDALKTDFVKGRGYTLIEEADATDGSGRHGQTMVLETTLSGRPVRELIAVFVIPGFFENTIRVVEYVADKETFATEVDGVRGAIATLK